MAALDYQTSLCPQCRHDAGPEGADGCGWLKVRYYECPGGCWPHFRGEGCGGYAPRQWWQAKP